MRTRDGRTLTSLSRDSGVSLGHLSDLESGRRYPTAKMVRALADTLRCPMSMLERNAEVEPSDVTNLRKLVHEVVREEMTREARKPYVQEPEGVGGQQYARSSAPQPVQPGPRE